ncbi:MAG: hypothetical protein HFJ38_07505 [Bacilli bacterium]|nr:hypothetical protein [Bacilli bacterium]
MKIRQEKGITLVALIITIIVLVILAAVTINAAFNSGIIDTAVNGAVNYADAQKKEQITFDDLDKNIQDIVKQIEDYNIGGNNPMPPTIEDPTPELEAPKQDGSYDSARKVNTPKVEGTGLIPVYHNGAEWKDLTSTSTKAEWNSWFNYDTQKWANARTADGSMWVWIPRYEYKINSSAKTIAVNFIEGTSTTTTSGYTLHPAFGTDLNNGGWSSDISGFWVAKYAAGFQNATAGEADKTVENSGLKYTTTETYTANYLQSNLAVGSDITLPVFKANTYAYNCISVGDSYLLTQKIGTAGMYGLRNVDSHLQKNSEWGAVAYLTHSKYGLNGAEVTTNSKNLDNTIDTKGASGIKGNVYTVTSYGDSDTANDTNASSTHNMSGVFDLSGCVWESTAGFCKGGNTSTPEWHSAMATNGTTASTKYVTIYENSYDANNKKGDAVKETSTNGDSWNGSWNGDYSGFVTTSSPVFDRGGYCGGGSYAGVFAFHYNRGNPSYSHGFRVVLIP